MAKKPPDENDRKRAGTFTGDPFEGTKPVPPLASSTLGAGGSRAERAALPSPDLDRDAPDFAAVYPVETLRADRESELVSLSHLPPWPGEVPAPAWGHGWGEHLDGLLGHGLRPGEMIGIGAASAGAGKTAWMMQLADGLALRNLEAVRTPGAQLTPVILASEMSGAALTWRSLARWTSHSASYFRGGKSMTRKHPARSAEAWAAAERAIEHEDFGASRPWLRLLEARRAGLVTTEGAAAFVEHLRALVELWRARLARQHPGHAIVPLVLVDPLQRYQSGHDDIADLNALARELCAATVAGKWITLLTSDTNKGSARGDKGDGGRTDSEEGAGVFRGSYNLIHEVAAALYLRRPRLWEPTDEEKLSGERHVEAVIVKARWGGGAAPWPRYRWHGPTARFYPMTAERAAKLEDADKQRVLQKLEDARRVRAEASRPTYGSTSRNEGDDDMS